jgi:IS30 family transposase
MGEKARVWFSARERAELWERWRAGQCIADIARALERRNKSGVYRILAADGGITPRPRRRAARALSLDEREEISRGMAAGHSIRHIARTLRRAASTVSREVKRHGGGTAYRASDADSSAWERARRPKRCRLARHPRLRWRVAHKLALQWSPKQISGWLKREYAGEEEMQISHETIYKSLFVQARGVLKKELMAHLRTQRQMRQAKGGIAKKGLGSIVDAVSIRERPAEVEDRAVPGHWEGDLLAGSNNTHIATLVERHTRFAMLIKVESKETATVVGALAKHVRRLPAQLRRSLTWDRGKEMADHKRFTLATDVKVYFCDPRSPWQRGSNENTNGLLRQYFPKGKDLSIYPQVYLDKIAKRLNQRPRETLGFECPADRLRTVLQ